MHVCTWVCACVSACMPVHVHVPLECACVHLCACVCTHACTKGGRHQGQRGRLSSCALVSASPAHEAENKLRPLLVTCLLLGLRLDSFLFALSSLSLFHIFLSRFALPSEFINCSRTKAMSYSVCDCKTAPLDLCSDSPDCQVMHHGCLPFGSWSNKRACLQTVTEGPDPSSPPSVGGQSLVAMPGRRDTPSPPLCALGTGAGTSV